MSYSLSQEDSLLSEFLLFLLQVVIGSIRSEYDFDKEDTKKLPLVNKHYSLKPTIKWSASHYTSIAVNHVNQ